MHALQSFALLPISHQSMVGSLSEPVETFRVELRVQGGSRGVLALVWERTEAYVPFEVAL